MELYHWFLLVRNRKCTSVTNMYSRSVMYYYANWLFTIVYINCKISIFLPKFEKYQKKQAVYEVILTAAFRLRLTLRLLLCLLSQKQITNRLIVIKCSVSVNLFLICLFLLIILKMVCLSFWHIRVRMHR